MRKVIRVKNQKIFRIPLLLLRSVNIVSAQIKQIMVPNITSKTGNGNIGPEEQISPSHTVFNGVIRINTLIVKRLTNRSANSVINIFPRFAGFTN